MVPSDGVSRSSRAPIARPVDEADLTHEAVLGQDLAVINGRSRWLASVVWPLVSELMGSSIDLGQEQAEQDQLSVPQRIRS